MPANIGEMMYVKAGGVPWHGLGKEVIGEQTAEQAIIHAGLDWKVGKKPIGWIQEGGLLSSAQMIRDKMAIVREDNHKVLSIMGDGYSLVQNKDSFRLMDTVIGEVGAHYHTAGYLNDGQVIWLLVKLPGVIRVVGDDIIEKYLLLVNSHDGSYALRMVETPIRVVCQNTLNAALKGSKQGYYQKHTVNMNLNVHDIRKRIGLALENFNIFEQLSKKMVEVKSFDVEDFLKTVIDFPRDSMHEEASTRMKNKYDLLEKLFYNGQGNDLPGVRGTLWAGYNAITEYVDHYYTKDDNNRARSALTGGGAKLKDKAFKLALELVQQA